MIAISQKETWEYVLKRERGSPTATTFILKPVVLLEQIQIEDLLVGNNTFLGTASYRLLKGGISSWRGMVDKDGKEIPCILGQGGSISDESIARIPRMDRAELSRAIWDSAQVTGEEEKNS